MKKTFSVDVPNKKPARQVDAIKHEIKKYIARERRRDLPDGYDFWDFDCEIGPVPQSVEKVHLTKVNSMIDQLVSEGKTEFYLSVVATPRKRQKK